MQDLMWKDIVAKYESRTKKSKEHQDKAVNSLPGGDTRWATFYKPYSTYMQKGIGSRLIDVDGNEYIDFQNNYTSLIHGHSKPEIIEAVKKALEGDVIYGAPCEKQYELAQRLVDRMPGMELVRFTNSGTEATMMAMRAARAFTGNEIIIKMDGAYHGSHDLALINTKPYLGDEDMPVAKPSKPGVPKCGLESIKIAKFNDLESVEYLLKKYDGDVAGVIIEPVMNTAGMVPASMEFIKGLRQLCDKYNTLLIFDEIVTFRLSTGGMQKIAGVTPDITALGKSIGGGFAVGAFGARKEIMQIFHPVSGSYFHSGTFNGHPVTAAAGSIAVRDYDAATIERVNALGARLKTGVDGAFDDAGIHGHCTISGSLLYVHWTPNEIIDATDVVKWKAVAGELPRLFHLELMNNGIHAANRGMMNISSPMTEGDVDAAIAKIARTIEYLKPCVEKDFPHLIKR